MKKLIFFSICFIVVFNLFSSDATNDLVDKFFSSSDVEAVVKGEIVSRMYIKYNAKGENTHLRIDLPKSDWTKNDFSKYEILCDEKAFFEYDLTGDAKLRLYNILSSCSVVSGMEYYSRSANKVEKLIVDAYKIVDSSNRDRTEDIVYSEIAERSENFYLQQDNKFGKLIFKKVLDNTGDSFVMTVTNEVPLSNIVKINNSGDYKIISFFIYDAKRKGYFYYAVNGMRVLPEFLLKNGFLRPTTFSNRLRAAYVHFLKQIGVDKKDYFNPWDEEKLKSGFYRTY